MKESKTAGVVRLWGMKALCVSILVFATAAVAQPKANPAELEQALATLFPDELRVAVRADHVEVTIGSYRGGSKPPAWEDLRERTRKAHAIVAPKTGVTTLVVEYRRGGALAIADVVPGGTGTRVRVGDGKVMLDDRAIYKLSATTKIEIKTETIKIKDVEMEGGATGAPICEGKVKNLQTTEVAVTARCVIHRHTMMYEGKQLDVRTPFSKGEIFLDETVAVGKVKPGAEVAFRRALKAPDKWPSTMGLSSTVVLAVNGIPMAHLDTGELPRAADWLRVIEQLRTEGLAIETRNPYGSIGKLGSGSDVDLRLYGSDDLHKRDPKEVAKLVDRAWKLLEAHYKKFDRHVPMLKVTSDMKTAAIEDGKLGIWRDGLF